jgi:hypothetical protein
MSENRLELGAAATVVTLAVVNVLNMYKDTAPKLADLRHSPAHDHNARQLLLDADMYGGIVVLLVGGGTAVLSRRLLPLVLAASGLLLISLYYRSVLASATPADVLGLDPTDKGA